MHNSRIIVFDGVCNFCNSAVNFVIKRDTKKIFVFTPMQSELGQSLRMQYGVANTGIDSLLLIKNERRYLYSSAALEIASELDGFWRLLKVLKLIPSPIRDYFYKVFAKHRYKLFGRRSECMIPTLETSNRFIGLEGQTSLEGE